MTISTDMILHTNKLALEIVKPSIQIKINVCDSMHIHYENDVIANSFRHSFAISIFILGALKIIPNTQIKNYQRMFEHQL